MKNIFLNFDYIAGFVAKICMFSNSRKISVEGLRYEMLQTIGEDLIDPTRRPIQFKMKKRLR